MTKEEAIEQIKNIKIFAIRDGYTNEAMDALDIAIEALEQQKTAHWIDSKDWKERSYDSMYFRKYCSLCNGTGFIQNKFCPNCGAKMKVNE